MIKAIDALPSSPADESKAKRDGMMRDVYTIIEQNIPLGWFYKNIPADIAKKLGIEPKELTP